MNMKINDQNMLSLSFSSIFILFNFYFSQMVASQVQTPVTKPIISFCAGNHHNCAVFDNKKMKCWGLKNSFGASLAYDDYLGDDTSELGDMMPYVDIGTNANIKQVVCGGYHTCVKLDSNDTRCIGSNYAGQAGIGSTANPVGVVTGYSGNNLPSLNLSSGLQVIDMALGSIHSCVLVTGNKVKCYGANDVGQLGLGDATDRGTSSSQMGDALPFVDLGIDVEVAYIHSSSQGAHNCVILSKSITNAQRIKCWGWNGSYQLGYGDTNYRGDSAGEMGDNLPLVYLGTESRVKQLALGFSHTCAILVTDALKCWGNGGSGGLGSGSPSAISSTSSGVPFVPIDSFKTIKFISTGVYRTCIVYEDMLSMKCVGWNHIGQLGQGDTTNRGNTPSTMIPSIPNINLGTESLKISSIYGGSYYNCVLFEDSSVKCFGDNGYGQLAIGSSSDVGNATGGMGNNLQFSQLFSPTKSSTQSPTKAPTPEEIIQELAVGLSVGIHVLFILICCSYLYLRRKKQPIDEDIKSRDTNNTNQDTKIISSSTQAPSNRYRYGNGNVVNANSITEEETEIKNNTIGLSTTYDHQTTVVSTNMSDIPVAEVVIEE